MDELKLNILIYVTHGPINKGIDKKDVYGHSTVYEGFPLINDIPYILMGKCGSEIPAKVTVMAK